MRKKILIMLILSFASVIAHAISGFVFDTKSSVTVIGANSTTQSPTAKKTKKKDKNTGLKWVEVQDGEYYGIEIDNRVIVPCRYSRIQFEDGFFIAGIMGNPWKYACYTKEGKCIIPESLGFASIGYSSLDPYIKVIKPGKKYGAYDLEGHEIMSTDLGYEYIDFNKKKPDLCRVEKGKRWGIYDIRLKKEIISPLKYDEVWIDTEYTSGKTYFRVAKDGKYGICLANGKEIIAPQYNYVSYSVSQFDYKADDGHYYDTGIDIDGNKVKMRIGRTPPTNTSVASTSSNTSNSSSYSSSSSSSSYSTSSSSQMPSSSQYGKLLFQGVYTNTGVVRNSTSITGCGQTNIDNFAVYEQALVVLSGSLVWPYVGIESVYGEVGRRYGEGQVFYLVTDNGQIRFVAQNGTDVISLYLDKGDTRSTYNGKVFSTPIGNGGNTYGNNGGNYNNQQQIQGKQNLRRCTVCYGRGVCSICNGSKWVTNSFGQKGLHKCGSCGGTGLCKSCNGTGRKATW